MSSNATTREDSCCPFDTYWWWFTKAASNQLGSIKPGANHGNNYQPQLVFIPQFTVFYASQVVFPQDFLNYQHISTVSVIFPGAPWVPTLHHHPPEAARARQISWAWTGVNQMINGRCLSFQEIFNRTHGLRTPKPEYLIALARNLPFWGSVGIRSHSIFDGILEQQETGWPEIVGKWGNELNHHNHVWLHSLIPY